MPITDATVNCTVREPNIRTRYAQVGTRTTMVHFLRRSSWHLFNSFEESVGVWTQEPENNKVTKLNVLRFDNRKHASIPWSRNYVPVVSDIFISCRSCVEGPMWTRKSEIRNRKRYTTIICLLGPFLRKDLSSKRSYRRTFCLKFRSFVSRILFCISIRVFSFFSPKCFALYYVSKRWNVSCFSCFSCLAWKESGKSAKKLFDKNGLYWSK